MVAASSSSALLGTSVLLYYYYYMRTWNLFCFDSALSLRTGATD
jgi:hypothetical protein